MVLRLKKYSRNIDICCNENSSVIFSWLNFTVKIKYFNRKHKRNIVSLKYL